MKCYYQLYVPYPSFRSLSLKNYSNIFDNALKHPLEHPHNSSMSNFEALLSSDKSLETTYTALTISVRLDICISSLALGRAKKTCQIQIYDSKAYFLGSLTTEIVSSSSQKLGILSHFFFLVFFSHIFPFGTCSCENVVELYVFHLWLFMQKFHHVVVVENAGSDLQGTFRCLCRPARKLVESKVHFPKLRLGQSIVREQASAKPPSRVDLSDWKCSSGRRNMPR